MSDLLYKYYTRRRKNLRESIRTARRNGEVDRVERLERKYEAMGLKWYKHKPQPMLEGEELGLDITFEDVTMDQIHEAVQQGTKVSPDRGLYVSEDKSVKIEYWDTGIFNPKLKGNTYLPVGNKQMPHFPAHWSREDRVAAKQKFRRDFGTHSS